MDVGGSWAMRLPPIKRKVSSVKHFLKLRKIPVGIRSKAQIGVNWDDNIEFTKG